ncbi:MAG: sulfotransferase [Ferrovibrio sp.]
MQFSGKTDLPFEPYFVVGGPRTGTTILHALVCTDESVNDYIAECSYFTALIKPFLSGWTQFDVHTNAYFPGGRQEFATYHSQLLRSVLHDIWQQVGCPKKLALKDPLLSGHIGTLAQLVPETKYVLSIRDPRDVVASRITVMRKENAKAEIGDQDIARICQEFNNCYVALVKSGELFRGRAILVPYEGLSRSGDLTAVEAFMGIACHPDRVWKSDHTDVNAAHGKSAWHTEQYGKPLNPDSIGNYARQLTTQQIDLVNKMCAPLMQQLGVPLA